MRIAVAADERDGHRGCRREELRRRGHEPLPHGALADGERDDWAWCAEAAARDVVEGRAEQAVVCCWTGTGASIAANKVAAPARRCAATPRPPPAHGGGTTRTCSPSACARPREAELEEILDAWFAAAPSTDEDDARTSPTWATRAGALTVLIDGRAAVRPELGGVERWARELCARLPRLRPARYRGRAAARGARPPGRARVGAGRRCRCGARRAELLLGPANLAPVAFPRNVVVIHDAAVLREPALVLAALRALARRAAAARSHAARGA